MLPESFIMGKRMSDNGFYGRNTMKRELGIARCGPAMLPDCLERNEKSGVVYHREGINGDYDGFDDVEALIGFIKNGER